MNGRYTHRPLELEWTGPRDSKFWAIRIVAAVVVLFLVCLSFSAGVNVCKRSSCMEVVSGSSN